ncbi:hypothetical protein JOQ06_018434 [Pogonophryne albipinna]|uniref:Uncharacterized protein n=1 Tax=Pogonophryne albipinna TaxID=1090488 RepID=A0AAD6AHX5_9TELE|nr:hypothetical protein JOQ06_018434 [Pogonophryne albipinna]
MAASEKESGSGAPHCTAVVILHFNGTPPLIPSPLSPPVGDSGVSQAGMRQATGYLTTGRQSDTITGQHFLVIRTLM